MMGIARERGSASGETEQKKKERYEAWSEKVMHGQFT